MGQRSRRRGSSGVDEKTGAATNDLGPSNVIDAVGDQLRAGDRAAAGDGQRRRPFVTMHLHPQHPVRTGHYSGRVLADGVVLPRSYSVFVSGVDP